MSWFKNIFDIRSNKQQNQTVSVNNQNGLDTILEKLLNLTEKVAVIEIMLTSLNNHIVKDAKKRFNQLENWIKKTDKLKNETEN